MSRATCDVEWESDGKKVHCQRWAVVSVDVGRFKSKAYCADHASKHADISKYK